MHRERVLQVERQLLHKLRDGGYVLLVVSLDALHQQRVELDGKPVLQLNAVERLKFLIVGGVGLLLLLNEVG